MVNETANRYARNNGRENGREFSLATNEPMNYFQAFCRLRFIDCGHDDYFLEIFSQQKLRLKEQVSDDVKFAVRLSLFWAWFE
jgi:hypothetical protein